MIKQAERIKVTKETNLARLLDDLAIAPVLLERKGKVYRIVEEKDGGNQPSEDKEDIWAGYDREKAKAAWMDARGILKGVDVDVLISDLHAQREQESAGRSE